MYVAKENFKVGKVDGSVAFIKKGERYEGSRAEEFLQAGLIEKIEAPKPEIKAEVKAEAKPEAKPKKKG